MIVAATLVLRAANKPHAKEKNAAKSQQMKTKTKKSPKKESEVIHILNLAIKNHKV